MGANRQTQILITLLRTHPWGEAKRKQAQQYYVVFVFGQVGQAKLAIMESPSLVPIA